MAASEPKSLREKTQAPQMPIIQCAGDVRFRTGECGQGAECASISRSPVLSLAAEFAGIKAILNTLTDGTSP